MNAFTMKKDEKDKIITAARLYDRLMGDGVSGHSVETLAQRIPVANPTEDAKKKAEDDAAELDRQASAQRKSEEARQESLRAQRPAAPGAESDKGDKGKLPANAVVGPGGKDPGQPIAGGVPAAGTERAKAEGRVSPQGGPIS